MLLGKLEWGLGGYWKDWGRLLGILRGHRDPAHGDLSHTAERTGRAGVSCARVYWRCWARTGRYWLCTRTSSNRRSIEAACSSGSAWGGSALVWPRLSPASAVALAPRGAGRVRGRHDQRWERGSWVSERTMTGLGRTGGWHNQRWQRGNEELWADGRVQGPP